MYPWTKPVDVVYSIACVTSAGGSLKLLQSIWAGTSTGGASGKVRQRSGSGAMAK